MGWDEFAIPEVLEAPCEVLVCILDMFCDHTPTEIAQCPWKRVSPRYSTLVHFQ